MSRKVATGIVRERNGYRAFVRVQAGTTSRLKTKRFPATATLTTMKQWREDQRVEARKRKGPVPIRGTLAEDIERYLKIVSAMPTIADRRRDLEAWREAFGDMPRAHITPDLIRGQLHQWRAEGPLRRYQPHRKAWETVRRPLAASTVNHRRMALLHLYTVLDGPEAKNPVRAVPAFHGALPERRALDLAFLEAAIARMTIPAHRIRASVLLWTGIRGNSELARMGPEHLDLEGRVCHVPSGKKATRMRIVPLNAKGIAAWQAFAAANLWGRYSRGLLNEALKRACRAEAAARGMPAPKVRTYDLRHSVATAYLNAGADLADVQDLLGHATPQMTRRYAPLQREKLIAAAEAIQIKLESISASASHPHRDSLLDEGS